MFSPDDRRHFTKSSIHKTLNVLDVLSRDGVAVIWRDNNSSSKGVADRVEYESFRNPASNPICDSECRDQGLLANLDEIVARHPGQDILLVLHTMGSHGPEYYRRYPGEFETFTPACKTNLLSRCSAEEIANAYDNSIVYTDYLIAKAIDSLKAYGDRYHTSLLYISDHGESLGEGNVYLHGLPYAVAPGSQTHVPAIAWLPPNSNLSFEVSQRNREDEYTHDDLYCTLLLAMDIATEFCANKRTMLSNKT
jgi:lipid A ethanolaminephosphotransferase